MKEKKKWRKMNNKRKIKEWLAKKAYSAFNFYIVCFGDTVVTDEKEMPWQGANSLTQFS